MSHSDATISQSRLLSCFQDRNNDFFRVSHIEPEEGDSAMTLSFCHSTFIPERYWPVASKMCAENLAVWKIRVNTHNRLARQYTNYSLITNRLRRFRFLKKLSFARFYPYIYMPPPLVEGACRHTRRRSMPEHGVPVSTYSADALFSTCQ